jgi:hypothetical protein
MTAFELIDSFFARPQPGRASHERRITTRQLGYLKDLIGADPEGGAMAPAGPGVWYWTPAGRNKYEITEDYGKAGHKIARLSSGRVTGTGQLF